jgi:lipopolysaccharide/colanic/teichoic acid biosynthesis glycosyltransferase
MVSDAERDTGPVLSDIGDVRVTPLGHWLRAMRIDELPQLWNVLTGEMSLVGPRPERPEHVSRFLGELAGYGLRHRVRPGITGIAQLHGRYRSHPREKLLFDLAYVYNGSLSLDLSLIANTGCDLLTGRLMWKR